MTDKSEIANVFFKVFSETPTPQPKASYIWEYSACLWSSLLWLASVEVSIPSVQQGLFKINHHKPAGIDGIPPLFYKKINILA